MIFNPVMNIADGGVQIVTGYISYEVYAQIDGSVVHISSGGTISVPLHSMIVVCPGGATMGIVKQLTLVGTIGSFTNGGTVCEVTGDNFYFE